MAIDDNRRRARRCSRACARRSAAADRTTRRARLRMRTSRRGARDRGPRCRGISCSGSSQRATDMASTVERVAVLEDARRGRRVTSLRSTMRPRRRPRIRARACAGRSSRRSSGAGAGLAIESRPTVGPRRARHHRLLLRDRRDGNAGVRDRHRDADGDVPAARDARRDRARGQIVAGMEDAFAQIRAERGATAARGQPRVRVLRAPATSSRRSCSARTVRAGCTSCS